MSTTDLGKGINPVELSKHLNQAPLLPGAKKSRGILRSCKSSNSILMAPCPSSADANNKQGNGWTSNLKFDKNCIVVKNGIVSKKQDASKKLLRRPFSSSSLIASIASAGKLKNVFKRLSPKNRSLQVEPVTIAVVPKISTTVLDRQHSRSDCASSTKPIVDSSMSLYKGRQDSLTRNAHDNHSLIQKYKEAFHLFDRNGDGRITSHELGTVMKFLCYPHTDDELGSMVKEVDQDGNGTIEFNEFVSMMTKHLERRRSQDKHSQDLHDAFNVFDRDKDGFITANEVREVMTCLGETLTDHEVAGMITAADTDGDGKINFQEFEHIWRDVNMHELGTPGKH